MGGAFREKSDDVLLQSKYLYGRIDESWDLYLEKLFDVNLMHSALKQLSQKSSQHRRVRKQPEGRRSRSKIGSVPMAYILLKSLLYINDKWIHIQ